MRIAYLRSGPSDHPGMTGSNRKLASRHPPVRLEIALARRLHHACRQWRGRGVAVPAAGAAFGVEIVAQRLLVETRLRLAGLVDDRPEPRAVWRHHLVDQDDAPVLVPAEFELCIRYDDATLAADFFAVSVDRAGHLLQRLGHVGANDLAHALNRDVLVVPGLGLGCRAENRGLELCAFGE